MKNKLKFFKKVDLILVLTLITIFLVFNKNIIEYGLPFFHQEDEIAFLKGTLSYISFITGIKRELSDPFFWTVYKSLIDIKVLIYK